MLGSTILQNPISVIFIGAELLYIWDSICLSLHLFLLIECSYRIYSTIDEIEQLYTDIKQQTTYFSDLKPTGKKNIIYLKSDQYWSIWLLKSMCWANLWRFFFFFKTRKKNVPIIGSVQFSYLATFSLLYLMLAL